MIYPINFSRIIRIFFYITLGFLCASIIRSLLIYKFGHPTLFGLARFLDVDGESNLPTWFSSSLLLAAAFVLMFIASLVKSDGGGYQVHWRFLAGVFVFLSIDEACCIHEAVGTKLQSAFHTSGYLLYPWVIPWCILLLITGLIYMRFLMTLPGRIRSQILLAAFIYVGGAVGVEIVEAGYSAIIGTERDLIYTLMTTVEEIMEMLGIVVFISALCRYIEFLGDRRSLVYTKIVAEPIIEDLILHR